MEPFLPFTPESGLLSVLEAKHARRIPGFLCPNQSPLRLPISYILDHLPNPISHLTHTISKTGVKSQRIMLFATISLPLKIFYKCSNLIESNIQIEGIILSRIILLKRLKIKNFNPFTSQAQI